MLVLLRLMPREMLKKLLLNHKIVMIQLPNFKDL
jgi:hypothetical protein